MGPELVSSVPTPLVDPSLVDTLIGPIVSSVIDSVMGLVVDLVLRVLPPTPGLSPVKPTPISAEGWVTLTPLAAGDTTVLAATAVVKGWNMYRQYCVQHFEALVQGHLSDNPQTMGSSWLLRVCYLQGNQRRAKTMEGSWLGNNL